MGGMNLTMNEEELLMERERKVEESYKSYYDSRPELKKESDELYDLFENDKISFEEYRKKRSNSEKNIDKHLSSS